MFSQDLDTTWRSNEFCILAEFQVRSPIQSPKFVAPLNSLWFDELRFLVLRTLSSYSFWGGAEAHAKKSQ
jgi:hypothetical protein